MSDSNEMRKHVSVAEAKRDLTKILREANKKRMEIVVTRRGEPFMVILPTRITSVWSVCEAM